jgi:acyl carrier protein
VLDPTFEERVRAAFAEALGTVPGDDEDFFDAGGDSLAAENVLLTLSAQLSTELPGWVLLDHPTVRGLAAALRSGEARI